MEQAEAKVTGVHFSRFEKGVKGYRLWDSKNKKKVLSRDVIFDERLGVKDIDKEEVQVEPTSIVQTRLRRVIKPLQRLGVRMKLATLS